MFGQQNDNDQQQADPAAAMPPAQDPLTLPEPGKEPATVDATSTPITGYGSGGFDSNGGSDAPTNDAPDSALPAPANDMPAPAEPSMPAANNDHLLDIKQQALQQLTPLVGHLDQSPEEKFRTTMMMIQASDNSDLLKDAYAAAEQIADEKTKAQALLDVVNEINYFTANHDK